MNPITQTKNLQKLIERDLAMGMAGTTSSWHNMYKDSAWIFIGGLNYELNEGDVITVFSQYGEIVNVNLIRDKVTGKSKGFAFVCYEDQRSTVLAVDNLNGITLVGRIIRVDHVESYKVPKIDSEMDEDVKKLIEEGCAPMAIAMDSKGKVAPVKREIKDETKEESRVKREESSRHSSSRKDNRCREDDSRSRTQHSRRGRSRSRSRSKSPEGRKRREVDPRSHHNDSDRRERRRSPDGDRSHHSRDSRHSHKHKTNRESSGHRRHR